MADLETRVATLEREVDSLKERQTATDADLQSVAELVRVEFRFTNSRIDRLALEVSDLKIDMDGVKGGLAKLTDTVEKLPRVVAEIVHEILDEKKRGGGA